MVQADNDQPGKLLPSKNQAIEELDGIRYLNHTRTTPAEAEELTDQMLTEWTILWQAPEKPGAVTFHAAAVAGNDDNSPIGDNVYRLELELGSARDGKTR